MPFRIPGLGEGTYNILSQGPGGTLIVQPVGGGATTSGVDPSWLENQATQNWGDRASEVSWHIPATLGLPIPTPAPSPVAAYVAYRPDLLPEGRLQSGLGMSLSQPAAAVYGLNPVAVQAQAAAATAGLGTIAKKLTMSLATTGARAAFGQNPSKATGGNMMQSIHPTIVAMRLVGRAFSFSGDDINISNFTLGGQSTGRRVIERIKSVLTLGQQVPEYLEGMGLNDNSAELVEALLVDFDSMLADGTILVPEPRRGGETRSDLFEQLNFLHFNLNNGNAWLTDNAYASSGARRNNYRRRSR